MPDALPLAKEALQLPQRLTPLLTFISSSQNDPDPAFTTAPPPGYHLWPPPF